MKTIKLPVHGIEITLGDKDPESTTGAYNGGSLTSNLFESGAYAHLSQSEIRREWDAVESFLLALAVAGVDVESPAVLEALETTVEAVSNHL